MIRFYINEKRLRNIGHKLVDRENQYENESNMFRHYPLRVDDLFLISYGKYLLIIFQQRF